MQISKKNGFREFSPKRLSVKPHFAPPLFGEILPSWIRGFNQSYFLLPAPAFKLFFPRYRIHDVIERFVIDQTMDLILLGETRATGENFLWQHGRDQHPRDVSTASSRALRLRST